MKMYSLVEMYRFQRNNPHDIPCTGRWRGIYKTRAAAVRAGQEARARSDGRSKFCIQAVQSDPVPEVEVAPGLKEETP